jgi:membrane protein
MSFNAATARAKIVDYVWTYNPCETGQRRSYWHHFLQIMVLVGRDLISGLLNLRSMGLVYTTLLAFIPLLAVSMWFLKWIGIHEQLEPGLASLLAPLGEQSVEFSSRIVEFVENMQIGLLGLLGIGMLVYTAVSLMRKIESAFNQTWRLKSRRSWVQRISIYLVLLAVGPMLISSALAVTASLAAQSVPAVIIEFPLLGDMIDVFGKFLPYMLVISAFTLIYYTVPDTAVSFGSAFYGGLLAGVLWQSTGILFAVFVGSSTSYTVIYSGFAIVMLFIVWVYLSWLILLIGASIAYYHQHPEVLKWRNLNVHLTGRLREQLALQLMLNIARSHQQQLGNQSSIEKLARYQQVPVEILQRLLDALEAGDLVCRSREKSPSYQLARSIDQIRLIDILRSLRSAQVTGPGVRFYCDSSISRLQSDIESSYESVLGERTLADLMAQATGENNENSLV